jgi:hypothetical protein
MGIDITFRRVTPQQLQALLKCSDSFEIDNFLADVIPIVRMDAEDLLLLPESYWNALLAIAIAPPQNLDDPFLPDAAPAITLRRKARPNWSITFRYTADWLGVSAVLETELGPEQPSLWSLEATTYAVDRFHMGYSPLYFRGPLEVRKLVDSMAALTQRDIEQRIEWALRNVQWDTPTEHSRVVTMFGTSYRNFAKWIGTVAKAGDAILFYLW